MADIALLRKFFIRVIHQIPAIAKSIAIWALGLLHLICLHEFPSCTVRTQMWRRRLATLGVTPFNYTFAFFETAAVVYIKMPFQEPTTKSPWIYHQHGRFYIGSTSIGASKREFNRMAKLRQIRHKMPVSTELALQYWARRSDFEMFTILVLKSFDTYAKAWTFEHLLISHWQPPLNHPFITKILSLKACGWLLKMQHHHKYFPSVPLGDRLFLRVRRRLRTLGSVPTIHSFQAQAWNTLFCLTSPGRLSFDTGRRLRTGEFHDWEIYALYRLANHLEQPKRGQARKLLASAMQFRNLTVPKGNKPVSIQFLAHDSFSKAVGSFSESLSFNSKSWRSLYTFLLQKIVKLHHQNYQRCYRISRHLITLIMAMTVLIFLVVVHSCWIKFPHIFAVMHKDSLDFMLLFLWKI